MTRAIPTGASLTQDVVMRGTRLADQTLPESAARGVNSRNRHSRVAARPRSRTVHTVVFVLLAWVDSLRGDTVDPWPVPAGERVQLAIASRPTDPAGTVELDLFGAVAYDPARFADLKPGNRRTVPPGKLRTWAISGSVLDGHGYQQ